MRHKMNKIIELIVFLLNPYCRCKLRYTSKCLIQIFGYFRLESNDFASVEHMGTHIDAPSHFVKGGMPLGDIPLTDLIASMVVIDVREKVTYSTVVK